MNWELIIITGIVTVILEVIFYNIGLNTGGKIGMDMGISLGKIAEREGWTNIQIEEFKLTSLGVKK